MSAGVDLSDMRRLLVIGPPGAGKSTLANRIASKVNLDVVHLDRLLWQPGWIQRDRAKFDTLLVEALNPSGWIIEGNHVGTLPKRLARADTVI
jgi:adenylate kinase family enzyme